MWMAAGNLFSEDCQVGGDEGRDSGLGDSKKTFVLGEIKYVMKCNWVYLGHILKHHTQYV